MIRHLEGTPIRKLAAQLGKSKSAVGRSILTALRHVPNSNHLSEILCTKFCGILIVDGKYVSVKGHQKKIPLIWCIDYLSHDILIHQLAPSENYQAYLSLFRKVKALNYPLEFLVCDDLPVIVMAAKYFYPKVKVQICINHYKETTRRFLGSRTNVQHQPFMHEVEYMFKATNLKQFEARAKRILMNYQYNSKYMGIMVEIHHRRDQLTTYLQYSKCPSTSNLIELFNSHLEARLHSIKGFESYTTAELWLNGYVMNRRLSRFTDCSIKFKHLNGKCSLSLTAKDNTPKVSLLRRG